MALIYFYDATELDNKQLAQGLSKTDHRWEFVEDKISTENLNPDTEVVSVFAGSIITKEIIESLPYLKLIATRSTGFNHIDLQAAQEHNVIVVNVPTYGEATVAEYAFTLLLALTRKLELVIKAENENIRQDALTGNDLAGKTIGVVGAGHIGQHSIKIANGFSMNIIAYDPMPKMELEKQLNFKYVDLDTLVATADIISLHAPYMPETHHIINQDRIENMKKSAVLVNTARGELVDTEALTEALISGSIAGAALDVLEGEQLLSQQEEELLLRKKVSSKVLKHSVQISILEKLPNVLISPHNAFNTVEAIGRINKTTTDNIIDFWYGKTPHRVKPSAKFGKLIISRHAESEWNASGQWTGQTDVHLSDKGFKEAAMLSEVIQSFSLEIDKAYCSEQIRTRETLEGILNSSQLFDVEINKAPEINERNYGDYTGKNKWEMKELLGEEQFNEIRRGWDVPIPNGETLRMVYDRVVPFYLDTIMNDLKHGKNVLVVAHGNSIRALVKYIESISDKDVSNLEMIFGEIIVYDVDEKGKIKQKDTRHINSPAPKA